MTFDVLNSKRLYLNLGVSEMTALSLLEKGIIKGIDSGNVKKRWHIPEMFVELFIETAKKRFGNKPLNELANEANQNGLAYRKNNPSAKVICFGNIKGGVGKTSIACNIAYILAMLEQRVLVVDMDAQSNTTDFLLKDNEDIYDMNIGVRPLFEMISKRDKVTKENVEENIVQTVIKKSGMILDLMPADIKLARQIEIGRAAADNPQRILKKILDTVKTDYDFIIIDTPPSPGLALQMSIYAADEMVLVTEASKKSVKGISELISEIQYAEDEFENNIQLDAIFINKHRQTTNIHGIYTKQISEIAAEHSIENVYAIRATTTEEKASAENTPLIEFKEELDSQMGTVKSMIEFSVKQILD